MIGIEPKKKNTVSDHLFTLSRVNVFSSSKYSQLGSEQKNNRFTACTRIDSQFNFEKS